MASQPKPSQLNLQPLRRWETPLVLLILVLLLAWFYAGQKQDSVDEDIALQQRQVTTARRELTDFVAANDVDKLNAELERIQNLPAPPQSFPSLDFARDFGATIYDRAVGLGVVLDAMSGAESETTIGDVTYTTVIYAITARGAPPALTSFLGLTNEFPSTVARGLSLERSGDRWTLSFSIIVIYAPEAAAPAPEAG